MQQACSCYCNMPLRLLTFTGLFAVALLYCRPVFAQQNTKDSVYKLTDSTKLIRGSAVNEGDEIITTFKALNFPPEMLMHYGELSPNDAITLVDEFQVTQKDEDGVAMLVTVKLRFDNDRLVGYIKEAPIDNTTDETVSNFLVRIPIEWLCTPETPGHPQHYVSTLAGIRTAETEYKCKGWHIKLPELERPELPTKKQKKEKKPKPSKKAAKPPV